MSPTYRHGAGLLGVSSAPEPRAPRPDPYPVPLAGGRGPLGRPPRGAGTPPVSVVGRSAGSPPPPSVVAYGTSRALVNLTLYALAQDANPGFHWLDVRSDLESTSQWDPVRLGWVESSRLWSTDPMHPLVPDHPPANAAIFHLVRSDEPPRMLARLADFLRLPSKMQEILAEIPTDGGSNLLAVANADRMTGTIPSDAIAPILDAFEWTGCSLFVGFTGTSPPSLDRFTHVVRIEGDSAVRWRTARVYFERVGAGASGAELSGASLSEIPFLERVFLRAVP
jgi:hypothetical protein